VPRLALLLLVATLLGALAGCSDGDDERPRPDQRRPITVWSLETEPDRLAATRRILARFTRRSGIRAALVGVEEDDLAARTRAAVEAGELPDVMSLPLAATHAYARRGITDAGAAARVVERLDPYSFSARALRLVSVEGRPAAVPSDGWGQLILYRRDLLERAALPVPDTVEALRHSAQELDRPGMAGITLATAPGEVFTQQSFEHVALAFGCELTDDDGRVALASAPCENALAFYADLVRASPGGLQDVDSTRAAYFAGRAAMILWSPFLLDALAGLRDDALPTCPQCRRDPAFLARNSGIVTNLTGPAGEAQYGEVSSWAIAEGANTAEAERFVEFMLTDGYLSWLALSPQGKYPVRQNAGDDLGYYADAWRRLESGVSRRAPLRDFYPEAAIDALAAGVEGFDRWGFRQGQGALVGAMSAELPVTRALHALLRGKADPAEAARQAHAAVQRLAAPPG